MKIFANRNCANVFRNVLLCTCGIAKIMSSWVHFSFKCGQVFVLSVRQTWSCQKLWSSRKLGLGVDKYVLTTSVEILVGTEKLRLELTARTRTHARRRRQTGLCVCKAKSLQHCVQVWLTNIPHRTLRSLRLVLKFQCGSRKQGLTTNGCGGPCRKKWWTTSVCHKHDVIQCVLMKRETLVCFRSECRNGEHKRKKERRPNGLSKHTWFEMSENRMESTSFEVFSMLLVGFALTLEFCSHLG